LAWAFSGLGRYEKHLTQHLTKIELRFTPLMHGRCAVHNEEIPPDQFGYELWYTIKSPFREYTNGRCSKRDAKTGATKLKQNSRDLCPGHRVTLFHLMLGLYLDKLALAGGDSRQLRSK
jgi:hypothetical protein